MATYTSNYGWTKPSGSDNVDISVLNDNLDDQDSTIHDAFLNMAPPFSESSTYAVDDIVLYGTGLYKCHTAVVTPGSWTGSTNWQVHKLSEGSGGGGTFDYTALSNKPSINGVTLSGNKTTSDLGINADNVMMSDGVTSITEKMGNVKMTKLWENPSPTSSFASKQIVISMDGYDLIFILFKSTNGSSNILSVTTVNGKGALMISSATDIYSRAFDTSTKTFTDGYRGSTVDNNVCIPYIIYGIKLT